MVWLRSIHSEWYGNREADHWQLQIDKVDETMILLDDERKEWPSGHRGCVLEERHNEVELGERLEEEGE